MGFAKVPHELRNHLHELTGSQLKVWLCHLLHEDKNHISFPSVPLIAKETGLDADTVGDAHKFLRENGWLKTVGSRDAKTGKFAVPVATCAIPVGVKDRDGKKPSRETTVPVPTVDGSTMDGKYPPEEDTFGEDTFEADTKTQEDTKIKSLVSELVREGSSEASPPHAQIADQKNTYDPHSELWIQAGDYFNSLWPSKPVTDESLVLLLDLCKELGHGQYNLGWDRVRSAWEWNQTHKKGKWKLFSLAELANALRSFSDRSLLAQMDADEGCPLCVEEEQSEAHA
jgi:hypothetical protein